MIGYWGRILYEVNSDWIQYPTDLTRTAEGRWETHYPIDPDKRPKRYFLGAEVGTVSFRMHFDARFTSSVNEMLDLFWTFVNSGYAAPLVIGDKAFGYDKFCCTKAQAVYKEILPNGVILSADIDVTLEECGDNGYSPIMTRESYETAEAADIAADESTSADTGGGLYLDGVPVYVSSDASSPAAYVTGSYALYDGIDFSGRYRICAQGDEGKTPVGEYVIGYVDKAYIG